MVSNKPTTFEIIVKVILNIVRFFAERASNKRQAAANKLVAWKDRFAARRNERIQKLELMKSAEKLADKK